MKNQLKQNWKLFLIASLTLGLAPFNRNPDSAFPFNGGESQALERLQEYFFTSILMLLYPIQY